MKALSVRQPWAELIASGRKTIELRTWSTRYRGPLLICAGALADKAWLEHYGFPKSGLSRGMALCIVELVDVRPAHPRDVSRAWFPPEEKHWAWELRRVSRFRPEFPVKGKLSLFEVAL